MFQNFTQELDLIYFLFIKQKRPQPADNPLAGVLLGLAASFYPERNNIVPITALAVMAAIPLILGRQPAAHE